MAIKVTNQITSKVPNDDPFAKLFGEFGRWQLLVFLTLSLMRFSSGWVLMAILFLTPNLSYRCVDLPNATNIILNDTCYEDCLKYEYDTSPFDNTIVSEWNLICDRRWLASFTQMMLQLGCAVGSFVFGYLADRYGRKNTLLIAISVLIVTGLGIPFSPNYCVFTALRTLLGFVLAGIMLVPFVMIMESVGPSYREIIGCLCHLPFIFGHLTVPLFAYYFRSWNTYTLALGIPPIFYPAMFFFVAESPRWLISHGRVDEAVKIVKKAAAINNMPTTKIEDALKQLSQDIRNNSDKCSLNYTALYEKALLLKTVCCSIMWLIFGIVFFGFNQYISQSSADPFVTVAISAIVQIPSIILSIWVMKKFGRRHTTSVFFILGGVFIIILYFVPKISAITITLGSVGVGCGAAAGSTIYIYTTELYPTVVRNMGFGVSSLFMRIGSMLAPFIANTAVSIPWLPTAIFGGSALFAGSICLLLPETKGTKFPDSMGDVTNRI